MAIIYHVMTGTYLPRSKKLFNCYCKAIDHLKEILNYAPKGLKRDDLNLSIKFTRIDTEKLPDYQRLFKESELKAPFTKKK